MLYHELRFMNRIGVCVRSTATLGARTTHDAALSSPPSPSLVGPEMQLLHNTEMHSPVVRDSEMSRKAAGQKED